MKNLKLALMIALAALLTWGCEEKKPEADKGGEKAGAETPAEADAAASAKPEEKPAEEKPEEEKPAGPMYKTTGPMGEATAPIVALIVAWASRRFRRISKRIQN